MNAIVFIYSSVKLLGKKQYLFIHLLSCWAKYIWDVWAFFFSAQVFLLFFLLLICLHAIGGSTGKNKKNVSFCMSVSIQGFVIYFFFQFNVYFKVKSSELILHMIPVELKKQKKSLEISKFLKLNCFFNFSTESHL